MKFIEHNIKNTRIIEVESEEIIINTDQDALELIANIDYQLDSRKIIIYKKNLNEDFFNLSTSVAGDILQKFSNYKVQLAIVGDFSKYNSKSLKDFIFESNKNKQIVFVPDISLALEKLS